MTTWTVSRDRILTRSELLKVLAELKRKAKRSPLTHRNLVLFRLACCCGLRASELTRLTLGNVRLTGDSPVIRVPKSIGKGGKSRTIPLWWDQGTLDDLVAWKALRQAAGGDLFIQTSTGKALHRNAARNAYQSCCRCLDKHTTIHDGRHTFISHALHAGRSVVEVMRAAGHASLATTSVYAHLLRDDNEVGNLFA
jgi:integrase